MYKFDNEQARTHLEILGYKRTDFVYLRALYPRSHPNKNDFAINWMDRACALPTTMIEEWQNEGRGVYFVVNGGGTKKDEITQCRAVWYEHDNLDKEAQINLWKELHLPEPTLQIDTGGKSIHNYWVFDKPISKKLWEPLQSDLVEYAAGDKSVKDASRVLRLAGSVHPVTKQQCRILSIQGGYDHA